MNKDIFSQLERIARSTVVDRAWLASNKRLLRAHMDQNPVIARPSRISSLFRVAPVTFAILALFIVGGVSRASQNSIPGDVLYGWKVGVVENVESMFVVGAQNRADFEVARTTERLQEVTELALRTSSDPDLVSAAQKRLENQISVASNTIAVAASVNAEKALETALKLGAALNAHESVLTTLENKVDVSAKSQIQDAISAIQNTTPEIQNTIEDLKEQNKQSWVLTKSEADQKIEAELTLQESSKQLDAAWLDIVALDESSDLRLKAEQTLEAAQEALTNAGMLIDTEVYDEALLEIQSAKQLISETEALLTATTQSGDTVKEIFQSSPSPSAVPSASVAPTVTPTTTPSASPTMTIEPTTTTKTQSDGNL